MSSHLSCQHQHVYYGSITPVSWIARGFRPTPVQRSNRNSRGTQTPPSRVRSSAHTSSASLRHGGRWLRVGLMQYPHPCATLSAFPRARVPHPRGAKCHYYWDEVLELEKHLGTGYCVRLGRSDEEDRVCVLGWYQFPIFLSALSMISAAVLGLSTLRFGRPICRSVFQSPPGDVPMSPVF